MTFLFDYKYKSTPSTEIVRLYFNTLKLTLKCFVGHFALYFSFYLSIFLPFGHFPVSAFLAHLLSNVFIKETKTLEFLLQLHWQKHWLPCFVALPYWPYSVNKPAITNSDNRKILISTELLVSSFSICLWEIQRSPS